MNKYEQKKQIARDSIIELMEILNKKSISYGELSYYQELITKLGKKFGLIKELKENGIL